MKVRQLNGDGAFALGALSSGVSMVTSYPGSPSSGTVQALIENADSKNVYVEWSSNEKVALEMAIGASVAGRRALVCVKSVGMNAMIDPLMALNLTPVHGGLVILVGDDPGAYGSQNDQDTRLAAPLVEMPLLEPAGPAEAFHMIREAFDVSELYHTAVLLRETRGFTQRWEPVAIGETCCKAKKLGMAGEPLRFVPVPKNAVAKHKQLHRTLESIGEWSDTISFNRAAGCGAKGIVAAGFTYSKLLDVTGQEDPTSYALLKLGSLFPLPDSIIADFLREREELLVLEETEPFVEQQLKARAHDLGCRIKIYGKKSGHLPREGELFRWQISEALSTFLPELTTPVEYCSADEHQERPVKKNYCSGCRYDFVLDALQRAAAGLDHTPVLVGDPGCLVTVAERLTAKYALGSSVAVADGMSKSGIDGRVVALFGDSAFFHTAIPAICNAAHNRSDIVMIVLDNRAALTSGSQPHPGINRDARGNEAPALSIEDLARACGVKTVLSVGPDNLETEMESAFREALSCRELCLVIVRLQSA